MTPSVAVVEEVVALELCETLPALVEEEGEEVVVAVELGWTVGPAAGMTR